MQFTFDNLSGLLTSMYDNVHKSAYIRQSGKEQKYLLSGNARMFARWYHSPLLKNTLLSPANLLTLANKHFRTSHYANPGSFIVSHPRLPYDLAFRKIEYSADNHPIINDCRVFIERISPGVNLNKNKTLPYNAVKSMLGEMSVCDTVYLEYICKLVYELDLTAYLDGVHVTTLAVTEQSESFFSLNKREAFMQVIKAAARISASAFAQVIPGYQIPITESYIISLLKTPATTRDLYSHLFRLLLDSFRSMVLKGAEFEIISPNLREPKKMSEMSEQELFAVFSSCTYVVNYAYLRTFIYAFGDYLKLINPFYSEVVNFQELHYNAVAGCDNHDGFMTPPAHYCLTPLALDIFGLSCDEAKHSVINTKIPLNALIEALSPNLGKMRLTPYKFFAKYANQSGVGCVRLKIYPHDNPELWKIIDFSDQYTLEQVHHTICAEFLLEPADTYLFNTDQSLSEFTAYTPALPIYKPKQKKTHITRLCDLPLEEKTAFFYVLTRSFTPSLVRYTGVEITNQLYVLEIVKIRPCSGIEFLPLVIRESPNAERTGMLMNALADRLGHNKT